MIDFEIKSTKKRRKVAPKVEGQQADLLSMGSSFLNQISQKDSFADWWDEWFSSRWVVVVVVMVMRGERRWLKWYQQCGAMKPYKIFSASKRSSGWSLWQYRYDSSWLFVLSGVALDNAQQVQSFFEKCYGKHLLGHLEDGEETWVYPPSPSHPHRSKE